MIQQKYFMIGVGGVGMSAIARILARQGHIVVGSDRARSHLAADLEKDGITLYIGHNADHVDKSFDTLVYTNAVPENNPELVRARELGIPCLERAEMLNRLASPKYSIGVAGTHGKTTTTSMVSRIFLHGGLDPSLAVGGYLPEIDGSGHLGTGKHFIYEACEAFGSLGHLCPEMALITNIDEDHLDYYGTLDNIKKMFARYMSENVPPFGLVVYNKDDDNLNEVFQSARPRNGVSVGIKHKDVDFRASDIRLNSFSSEFDVIHRGKNIGRFTLNVPGKHNVYNALLAITAARLNGISIESIRDSLSSFKNADRRFQLKYKAENLMVIDDYAHHPSEIDATLTAGLKLSHSHNANLIVIFQPHLFSRTEQFYREFARALSKADYVVLTEIYPAREENIHNTSSEIIYNEIIKLKQSDKVIYTHVLEEVPHKIEKLLENNSVVMTLGAGDVWKISEMFTVHA